MKSRRGKRVLSQEEHWLWSKVSSAYEPLKGKPLFLNKAQKVAEPAAIDELSKPMEQALVALNAFQAESKLPDSSHRIGEKKNKNFEAVKIPPLAPLERKTLRSVRRGLKPVEGVLDLHGMRQSEAHYALLSFLRQSQARGASLVLVITGKGDYSSGLYRTGDERGVLKRVVPQWLSMPDVRSLVLSFSDAAQHHGGAGALYVRLRRSKA